MKLQRNNLIIKEDFTGRRSLRSLVVFNQFERAREAGKPR